MKLWNKTDGKRECGERGELGDEKFISRDLERSPEVIKKKVNLACARLYR
tara:strand:- start:8 stop:157 length:150 start_codon:yes stop_codon:yes gene_type:complete